MAKRVGISGIGPVTAFGVGIDPLWSALLEGRSGIDTIKQFDASLFGCPYAAELDDDFKVRDWVPKHYRKAIKVMCRDIELAMAAAMVVVKDASIITAAVDKDAEPTIAPERMGCQIGAGLICTDISEVGTAMISSCREDGSFDMDHWGREGMQRLTPLWLLKSLPNMLACHVTIAHDCRGPSNTITCWESSAALSLSESMRVIQRGAADACLSGGCESRQNPLAFHRQCEAGRLTSGSRGRAQAVRPFHDDADGCVLGEGGGLLVVESLDNIEQRGGRLYAEILGTGCTQTIDDWTSVGASAESIEDAIRLALAQANRDADSIDAIIPFGSGIPVVDSAERDAMHAVFGERSADIPLVLLVPATGNCCSGHGSVQLAVAAKCIETGTLPPRQGEPVEGLHTGYPEATTMPLRNILVLSASYGGQNTAVILGGGS